MLGIEIIKRLGGGGGNIVLADASVTGAKYAQWTIGFDGFTYKRQGSGASVKSLAWINPQNGMENFEVRATVSSGDVPPGTLTPTWLPLTASQTWGWANQLTEKSCALLIEIRRASDAVVVGSATITLFVAGIE